MPSTVMGLSAGISIGGKKAGISIEYGVASQVLLPQSQPEAIAVEMTAPIINNLDADLEFMLSMNFYFTVPSPKLQIISCAPPRGGIWTAKGEHPSSSGKMKSNWASG